jgi:hypothetical protein
MVEPSINSLNCACSFHSGGLYDVEIKRCAYVGWIQCAFEWGVHAIANTRMQIIVFELHLVWNTQGAPFQSLAMAM